MDRQLSRPSLARHALFVVALLNCFWGGAARIDLSDEIFSGHLSADTVFVDGQVTLTGTWQLDQTTLLLSGRGKLIVRSRLIADSLSKLHITQAAPSSLRHIVKFEGAAENLRLGELRVSEIRQHVVADDLAFVPGVRFSLFDSVTISNLIINSNAFTISSDTISFDSWGALAFNKCNSIKFGNYSATNNHSSHKAASLALTETTSVRIYRGLAHGNTTGDTILTNGQSFIWAGGGGSIWVDSCSYFHMTNMYVSHDFSIVPVIANAEVLLFQNVSISDSYRTVGSYDLESGATHRYEQCSFIGGTRDAFTSIANDQFINCVIAGSISPTSGEPVKYAGSRFRTVTYENTAINYDCGSNCAGTIALARDFVQPLPAPTAPLTRDDIADRGTPSLTSPLVDRAPALASVTTDLLGRPRPQGPLADLGAFERPVMVSTTAPSTARAAFTLSPNPARDYVLLEWESDKVEPSTITIVDALGREVLAWGADDFSQQPWRAYRLRLPKALIPGTYTLRVRDMDAKFVALPLIVR